MNLRHSVKVSTVIVLALLVVILVTAFAEPARAQYIQRKVVTTSGAVTFIGNTLGLNKHDNDDEPGTNGSIGTFITVDTTQRDNPNWPFGTHRRLAQEQLGRDPDPAVRQPRRLRRADLGRQLQQGG